MQKSIINYTEFHSENLYNLSIQNFTQKKEFIKSTLFSFFLLLLYHYKKQKSKIIL